MPLGGSPPFPLGLLGQGPTGTFLRARLQRTRGGSQCFSWGNPDRGGSYAGFLSQLAVQLSPNWVRRSSFKGLKEASDLSSEALGA